jgi:N,N'-diacetyllegionaminate synthase
MAFVIAEIGVNHNGDLRLAEDLIRWAKAAGADAVKFQTFSPEALEPPGPRRDLLEELDLGHQEELCDYATSRGIEFMSSAFSVETLEFLYTLDLIKRIKIPSGEIDNLPLLRAAESTGLPIIISTGMSDWPAIAQAMKICSQPTLLHCVSAYPCPTKHANLRRMVALQRRYHPQYVGLSDHTTSTTLPAVAVGMGAVIVEKHLTYDQGARGPDHAASLGPVEFEQMVKNIREVEFAMGNGLFGPQEVEQPVIDICEARRSHRG